VVNEVDEDESTKPPGVTTVRASDVVELSVPDVPVMVRL
jgi:hypothetical protein